MHLLTCDAIARIQGKKRKEGNSQQMIGFTFYNKKVTGEILSAWRVI